MNDDRSLNRNIQHWRQAVVLIATLRLFSRSKNHFSFHYVVISVAWLLACRTWLVSGKDVSEALLCLLSVASRRGGGFSSVPENRRMLPGILLYGLWLNRICRNMIPVWISDHVPILLVTCNINQHSHAQPRLINNGTQRDRTPRTVEFKPCRVDALHYSLYSTICTPQVKKKVKPIPEGSRRLRFPDFKTIGTWRW